MDLRDITACVLVKNEAHFIAHVVSPLLKKLGAVLVFDTGSEDGTPDICEGMGCKVVRKNPQSQDELGSYRTEMNAMAETPWTMIVDGDELNPVELLDDIAKHEVLPGKIVGFTPMISVDFVDGQYVMMDDKFSRLALHPRGTIYKGDYPFESPVTFADPGNFFYIQSPHMAYHLHRLNRSPLDDRVFMRKDKQFLYSLQEKVLPVIGPVALPLDPNYPDPYAVTPVTQS
jgi:glycosyltransferase involved in cell wall biosynthesis